jgi:hypothetical protein
MPARQDEREYRAERRPRRRADEGRLCEWIAEHPLERRPRDRQRPADHARQDDPGRRMSSRIAS